jgi:hypothetical protein
MSMSMSLPSPNRDDVTFRNPGSSSRFESRDQTGLLSHCCRVTSSKSRLPCEREGLKGGRRELTSELAQGGPALRGQRSRHCNKGLNVVVVASGDRGSVPWEERDQRGKKRLLLVHSVPRWVRGGYNRSSWRRLDVPRIGSPSIFFSFIIFPYISFCSSVIDLDMLGSRTGFGMQRSKEMPTLVSIVDLTDSDFFVIMVPPISICLSRQFTVIFLSSLRT